MTAYSVQDNVALLELRAPPVNAIGFALLDELGCRLQQAIDDPQVRGIVITGGSECFSAGADLAIFQGIRGGDEAVRVSRLFQDAFQAIEDSPKPVVAAVAGHVLGGALELAMSCHLRLATEGSRFSMPEVNLGINPGAGGTQRLPRLVGLERALEMLLSGRPIDSQTAFRWGLIDAICPPERLIQTALGLATTAELRKTGLCDSKPADAAGRQAALARAEEQVMDIRAELVAPRKILDAVRVGADESFQAGLLREQEAFRKCIESPATLNKFYVLRAKKAMGKTPIPAWNQKGSIVNRLFTAYVTEAFWLLEEGADPFAVDRAMVEFGFAMGPFQLIDM